MFFNLNDLRRKEPSGNCEKTGWFQDLRFRQAVSAAIDRDGIVRLVYSGRATAIWDQVTPGNKLWVDDKIAHPKQSVERASELLQSAGFSWKDGALVDPRGNPVEFSILTSASNAQRRKSRRLFKTI